ncbi:MAG: LamG-like jellyroll fold domain-containing protein [Candidatus Auribacterota bacterium]|jgi:hypothetical protein|nr:LamG-like jellyroll fold domain-containing protein [Candidatus Auribacterota bacterium]
MTSNFTDKILCALLLMFSLFSACETTYATNRALWVWSMSTDILLDKSGGDRADFFSFLAAPHGDTAAKIDIVYMSFHDNDVQLYPDMVAKFIADAHSRGIEVHFLTGDKHWALTEYHQEAIDVLELVLNYNASVNSPEERFDAIQFDIEPYTLTQWEEQHNAIWTQYMVLLNTMQNMVNTHNTTYSDSILNGVAIPRWFDNGFVDSASGKYYNELLQDIVDYIAIMNYSAAPWAVGDAAGEIAYADSIGKHGSVYVGYETLSIDWPEDIWLTDSHKDTMYNHRQSFWVYGVEYLETRCADVETMYSANPSYGGLAIHYYEDIRNGKFSYRMLGFKNNNHAPVAFLDSPNGGEQWQYSVAHNMSYRVYDQDNDTVYVTISASLNGGSSWIPLVSNQEFTGTENTAPKVFYWDMTSTWDYDTVFPDSSETAVCQLRITVVDSGGLSTVDRSDYSFIITKENPNIQPPVSTGVLPSVIYPAYPVDGFFITWEGCFNAPSGGSLVYYYSLYDQTQPEKALLSRSEYGYLPVRQSGLTTVTVWAATEGGVSQPVTLTVMVYPDMDGDGVADPIDPDRDGDGISDTDERTALTGGSDPSSYPHSARVGIYQMDNTYANHLPNKPILNRTPSADKTFQPGRFGYTNDMCVQLTTPVYSSSNRISVSYDITPQSTTALTVEMWVKPDPASTYSFIPLVFEGDVDKGFSLFLRDHTEYVTLRYYYTGSSGKTGYFVPLFYPNTSLFDGQWHHIAFTFNGIDNTLALYIDGERVAYTKNANLVPFSTTRKLRFFDATSVYDKTGTYYQNLSSDNTAQFYALPYLNTTSSQYLGSFDDIRVTRAVVPRDKLGYFVHSKQAGIDSDNDSLSDLDELLVYFTNPYGTDSDNDGLGDAHELTVTNTDPARNDTDEDSQRDGYELNAGSDPRDRTSFYLASSYIGISPDQTGIVVMWEGGNNLDYTIYWRSGHDGDWNAVCAEALAFITEDRENHIFYWIDTGACPEMQPEGGLSGSPIHPNVSGREYKIVYPVE